MYTESEVRDLIDSLFLFNSRSSVLLTVCCVCHRSPSYGDHLHSISKLTNSERVAALTHELLCKRWEIGLAVAKQTLCVTGIRNVYVPAQRQLGQRTKHLNFPNLCGKWFTNAMFGRVEFADHLRISRHT